jgi:hypothetical protein
MSKIPVQPIIPTDQIVPDILPKFKKPLFISNAPLPVTHRTDNKNNPQMPSPWDYRLPDSPGTDPGVRFSRTGLFRNTRFRIGLQAREALGSRLTRCQLPAMVLSRGLSVIRGRGT